MSGLGAVLAVPALGLTVAGAALGLRGCARRGVRAWAVHLVLAAAMLAMLTPADPASRWAGVASAEWPLVLTVALAWTVADAVRSRLVASRHGAPEDHRALAASARGHTRETVDLAAATLLLVALGTTAPPASGTAGTTSAAVPLVHAHHVGATDPGMLVVVVVLVGWAVALLLLASDLLPSDRHASDRHEHDRHEHDRWGLAGSAVMLVAMAAMSVGHGAG